MEVGGKRARATVLVAIFRPVANAAASVVLYGGRAIMLTTSHVTLYVVSAHGGYINVVLSTATYNEGRQTDMATTGRRSKAALFWRLM